MDAVACQGDDKEMMLISEAEYIALKEAYKTKMRNDPTHEMEFTRAQASALLVILRKRGIFVDLAVWVPFGDRNMPRRKFGGFLIGVD